MPHKLPQPYGVIDGYHTYPGSEVGGDYTSPGSSNWYADEGSSGYAGSEYGQGGPKYVATMPVQSYTRGTPSTPGSYEVSIGEPRHPGATVWSRSSNSVRSKSKRSKKTKNSDSGRLGDVTIPLLSLDGEAYVLDIEAFVNRSTMDRHIENDEKKGDNPPRPMNNFMLYRKAFQEKAKLVSAERNHQKISQIVAKSWKEEDKSVRDRFARFAATEKANHMIAFPDYQFRPNKATKGKKRKAGHSDEETDETEDLDWSAAGDIKRSRQLVQRPLPSVHTPERQEQYAQPVRGYEYRPQDQAQYSGYRAYEQHPADHWGLTELNAIGTQFESQSSQEYHAGGDRSGLPGGGSILLHDTNFDNTVFDGPSTGAQTTSMAARHIYLPRPFIQEEQDEFDPARIWRTPGPSFDAKPVPPSYPHIVDPNDDFFTSRL